MSALSLKILWKILFGTLVLSFAGVSPKVEVPEKPLTVGRDDAYVETAIYRQLGDFVADALGKTGIKITFIDLPLERGNILNSLGEIDAQLARVPEVLSANSHLRATQFPYFHVDVRIVYLKSNKKFDESNLQKYRGVALLNQTRSNNKIAEDHLNVIQVKTALQALTMLKTQKVDYVLIIEPILQDTFARDTKLKDQVVIGKRVFVSLPLYFVVHERYAYLLPRIEEALKDALKNDRSKYPLLQSSLILNP